MARIKGPKKTNRYPDEFKIKAVQLADHPGILAKDVAEDLGVHPILLYRWRKEYRGGKFKEDGRKKKVQIEAKRVSELLRIQELEREIKKLRVENELLKKNDRIQLRKKKDVFEFIDRHKNKFGICYLCRLYGVSKSGYYAWKERPESLQRRRRRFLEKQILRVFNDSKGRYGSPRIQQALRKRGDRCSKNTVAEIMRSKGLKARVHRVYVRNPKVHRFFKRIGNVRYGQTPPHAINQVWVGDVTYIKLTKGFQYLAAVMDLYSPRLVGWSIGSRRTVTLTKRALRHAIRKRHPPKGLIFHSDRGIEYCAYEYHDMLNRYDIVPSVNRPGCCQDNAHMESFFHSIKGELIRNRSIHTGTQLKHVVKGYITHFYITKRLHSALNYCSPLEFEQQASQ